MPPPTHSTRLLPLNELERDFGDAVPIHRLSLTSRDADTIVTAFASLTPA
jgi:hypothetical protein